jgi:hypothetical protein
MNSADYDDPKLEAEWLAEQREKVLGYLQDEAVLHGGVAANADWFCAPYASIWAVESVTRSDAVGWWVISGDLPTDYLSGGDASDARAAMAAFARRWREASVYLLQGKQHPTVSYGPPGREREFGDLLSRRAEILEDLVNDDEMWQRPEA